MAESIALYEHPDYKRAEPVWLRHRDLYIGDHETLVSPAYLWPHAFERKADGVSYYRDRCARTRYLNLVSIMIAIWQGYYFKREAEADKDMATMLGDDINNIDGRGTSLFAFVKGPLLTDFLLYEKACILVDSFKSEAETDADAATEGQRPFLQLVPPLALKDWQRESRSSDQYGAFDWLRWEYDEITERETATAKPSVTTLSDVLALKEGVFTIERYQKEQGEAVGADKESRWKLVDTIVPSRANGETMSYVPAYVLTNDCSLKDAAEESLRFHNKRSVLDNIDLHQGYKKVFISGVDASDTAQRQGLTEYAVGILPRDSNVISIEPTDTASLRESMVNSLDSFFKVGLRQVHSLPADSREAQSAEAQAAERANATSIVLSNLEQLENFINEALRAYADFKGISSDFQGHYTLSREVEFESLDSQVLIYNTVQDAMRQAPEWRKSTLKRIAKFQNLPEEEFEVVKEEIDNMPAPAAAAAPGAPADARAQRMQAMMKAAGTAQETKPIEGAQNGGEEAS